MKERYGKGCTICDRPFTTFRWCPGKGMRYKKTEVTHSLNLMAREHASPSPVKH